MAHVPFDQLAEIVDAVGDKIDVLMDSGIQRGTHVIKALSLGAKAVGGGRFYLFRVSGGRKTWSKKSSAIDANRNRAGYASNGRKKYW